MCTGSGVHPTWVQWRGGRFRAQHGVGQLRWRNRLREFRGYTGWLETRGELSRQRRKYEMRRRQRAVGHEGRPFVAKEAGSGDREGRKRRIMPMGLVALRARKSTSSSCPALICLLVLSSVPNLTCPCLVFWYGSTGVSKPVFGPPNPRAPFSRTSLCFGAAGCSWLARRWSRHSVCIFFLSARLRPTGFLLRPCSLIAPYAFARSVSPGCCWTQPLLSVVGGIYGVLVVVSRECFGVASVSFPRSFR